MVLPEHPPCLKQLPRLAFDNGTLSSWVDNEHSTISLEPSQRHYLERVRRLRLGQPFLAFDSSGRLWKAVLTSGGAEIEAELRPISRELPYPLELAISIPKGSGFDDLVRPLTELGVTTIVPIISQRTVVVASAKKVRRWRAIAREAVEQCERLVVPTIAEPISLQAWLQASGSQSPVAPSQDRHPQQKFIAAARQHQQHLMAHLINRDIQGGVAVAVGPEGGWADEELEQAIETGVEPVGLGPRILRTVTAPLAIASWVAGSWESQGSLVNAVAPNE
ncbi:MAG: 16S rRNA (uracil(1498)-N(3))-methyltransferase [Synechococcus sp.]